MYSTRDESDVRSARDLEEELEIFHKHFGEIEAELSRIIVGMRPVVRATLSAIFAGGHVLLEGVPGLGKTLLVKSIALTLGLSFKRIQFTPDLMPSDVTGTQVLSEDEERRRLFVFKAGPLFSNIVLADEVNRATPKTQSALLEAMEERQVTVLDETYILPKPFFVLATQNPVELEGTYPLPEAQLDRFLFKVLVSHPTSEELKQVLTRTTGVVVPSAKPIFDPDSSALMIERMKQLVRNVYIADPLLEVLVRMIAAVTPGAKYATEKVKKYVRFGPGPRGAQAIMLGAKVHALLDGRVNIAFEDIQASLIPALRHRLILNFQSEADGITSDMILEEIKNAR
jgi:MoxR-like ATPase